jgi:hypothetical protein
MAQGTLFLAGTATLVAALAYAYVGLRLLDRRALDEPAGRAMGFFSLWWLATAMNQVGGSLLYLAASAGWTDLDLQLSYVVIQRMLLALSLVGLMYYLLYLFRGKGHLVPLLVGYGVYAAVQVYTVVYGQADGVELFRWRTDLHYAMQVPAVFQLVNVLFIIVLPLGGSLALWRLYPKVSTRGQRVRLIAVSTGFTAWWLFAVVAGQRAFFDNDWLQGFNRLLGLAVAIVILLAYEPPAWMRRRFGVEPYRSAAT